MVLKQTEMRRKRNRTGHLVYLSKCIVKVEGLNQNTFPMFFGGNVNSQY